MSSRKLLKTYMKEKGIQQEELGAVIGKGRHYVMRLLKWDARLTAHDADRISRKYGIPMAVLIKHDRRAAKNRKRARG